MKHSQRIISTMLIIITLLAILPVSASAAYRVETLKFNQWYSLKEDVRAVYKIKISADTILEATWKNNKHNAASIKIYTDKECEDNDLYTILNDYADTGTVPMS